MTNGPIRVIAKTDETRLKQTANAFLDTPEAAGRALAAP